MFRLANGFAHSTAADPASRAGFAGRSSAVGSRLGRLLFLGAIALMGVAEVARSEKAEADLLALDIEDLLSLEVSTSSKISEKIVDAPATVTVVTAEDIRAYGYRTLGEILRSIPGLHLSYDRSYQYLGVRGFNFRDFNQRILVLLDGQRLNENMFSQGFIEGMLPVEPELIERVEFVAGPGSSIYGNNALLGVVNVITKGYAAASAAEAIADVGSERASRGLVRLDAHINQEADMLVSASHAERRGGDLRFPEHGEGAQGIAHDLDAERISKFFGKARYGDLALHLGASKREKEVPTAPYETLFNDPGAQLSDQELLFSLGHSGKTTDKLKHAFHFTFGDYAFLNDYRYLSDPGTLNHDAIEGKWLGTDLLFDYLGFERQRIVAGIDAQWDIRQHYKNYDATPSPFLWYRQQGDSMRWGLYLHDEISPTPNLMFHVGGRWDHYRSDGRLTDESSGVRGRFSNSDQVFNPRLAAIYKPHPRLALKLLYNSAFRAPDATEIGYVIPPRVIVADLGPERIKSTELAAEYFPSTALKLTTRGFYTRFDAAIILDPVDPARTINGGEYLSRGIETAVEWQSARRQRLRASLTLQHVTDENTGATLEDAPRYLAKFNYTLPLWESPWRLGLEAQLVGPRDTPEGGEVGAYPLVNLTLTSMNLWKNLDLSASCYNLLDKNYADPARAAQLPITSIPQDGRSFRLLLKYSFF